MRSLLVFMGVLFASFYHAYCADSVAQKRIVNDAEFLRLLKKSESVFLKDKSLALRFLDTALLVSTTDSTAILTALLKKGEILYALGKSSDAKEHLIVVASKNDSVFNKSQIARANNLLCSIYTHEGDFRKALTTGYKARLIYEEEKTESEFGSLYYSLGQLYFKMQNFEKSIFFYRKSIKWDFKSKEHSIPIRLFNISLCYSAMDSTAKAIAAVEEGIKACNGSCSVIEQIHSAYALGVASLKQCDFVTASENFAHSLTLTKNVPTNPLMSENLMMLGSVLTEERNYDSALVMLKQAEEFSTVNQCDKCLLSIYERMIEVYESTIKVKEQTEYQQKYIDLKDKMFNGELMRDLAIVEGQHLEREHLDQIAFQEKELQAQEEMLKYQLIKAVLIGVVCVLLLILVVILIRSVRMKKTIHDKLEAKVQERIAILEEKKRAVLAEQEEKRQALIEFTSNTKRKLELISEILNDSDGDPEIIEQMKLPVGKLYELLTRAEARVLSETSHHERVDNDRDYLDNAIAD